jgi:hypothetical protein
MERPSRERRCDRMQHVDATDIAMRKIAGCPGGLPAPARGLARGAARPCSPCTRMHFVDGEPWGRPGQAAQALGGLPFELA